MATFYIICIAKSEANFCFGDLIFASTSLNALSFLNSKNLKFVPSFQIEPLKSEHV